MNIPPEEVHKDIRVLVATLQTLPSEVQTAMGPAVVALNNTLNQRQKILKLVQDALAQLRLDMKYIIFDLEATRRERDELLEGLDR